MVLQAYYKISQHITYHIHTQTPLRVWTTHHFVYVVGPNMENEMKMLIEFHMADERNNPSIQESYISKVYSQRGLLKKTVHIKGISPKVYNLVMNYIWVFEQYFLRKYYSNPALWRVLWYMGCEIYEHMTDMQYFIYKVGKYVVNVACFWSIWCLF